MITISPQSSRSPGLADHWTAELPRDHSSANSRLSLPLLEEAGHETVNATWYWMNRARVRVYLYLTSFISKKRLYSEGFDDTQIMENVLFRLIMILRYRNNHEAAEQGRCLCDFCSRNN